VIIRESAEDEIVLVNQTDHSRLVGQIAAHWGNDQFAKPAPNDSVIRSAAYHDYGWVRYETSPLFDEKTNELYHFKNPPVTALHMEGYDWCVDWLMGQDPFASLMVSRHRTGLWRNRYGVVKHPPHPHFTDMPELVTDFIDRHEARQAMDMPKFDRQDFDMAYRLLQFWDILGLYFCCQDPYDSYMEPVPTRRDEKWEDGARVDMTPIAPGKVRFAPFPFDEDGLKLQLLVRRLKRANWASSEEFRADFWKADTEILEFQIVA
jgi:hypothetical protein